MEIARRAAATVRLDDDYRFPYPSPPHGQMSVDALRRELVKESIRQEVIAAELAKQRELEPEARLPKKPFSWVKTKSTAETLGENSTRSSEKWICPLCNVNTTGEISFEEHCAGYRHQSNVADMEWAMETAEPTIITAEFYSMHHNPTAWNCSVCQVKCTGDLDLENHLNGRRHQKNLGALWREREENEGEVGFQLVDKNQRPTSGWTCSICQANCTSESDLENHLWGRRHQQNVKAQLVEGGNATVCCTSWW